MIFSMPMKNCTVLCRLVPDRISPLSSKLLHFSLYSFHAAKLKTTCFDINGLPTFSREILSRRVSFRWPYYNNFNHLFKRHCNAKIELLSCNGSWSLISSQRVISRKEQTRLAHSQLEFALESNTFSKWKHQLIFILLGTFVLIFLFFNDYLSPFRLGSFIMLAWKCFNFSCLFIMIKNDLFSL